MELEYFLETHRDCWIEGRQSHSDLRVILTRHDSELRVGDGRSVVIGHCVELQAQCCHWVDVECFARVAILAQTVKSW